MALQPGCSLLARSLTCFLVPAGKMVYVAGSASYLLLYSTPSLRQNRGRGDLGANVTQHRRGMAL
jgi:hypothetical protein